MSFGHPHLPVLENIATKFEQLANEETTNEAILGVLIDTNHKTREMILRLRSYNADWANTFEKEYDALLRRAEDACNKGGDSTVLRKYLRSHAKGLRSVKEELAGCLKEIANKKVLEEKVLEEFNSRQIEACNKRKIEPDEERLADTTAAKQQKDIWEGISTEMKSAIQDYWRESKDAKSKGKRLYVETFCSKRELGKEIFRSEKDKVEKRKNRPGWADQ